MFLCLGLKGESVQCLAEEPETPGSWLLWGGSGREGSVYPDWTGSRLLETTDRSPESALRAHILQSEVKDH